MSRVIKVFYIKLFYRDLFYNKQDGHKYSFIILCSLCSGTTENQYIFVIFPKVIFVIKNRHLASKCTEFKLGTNYFPKSILVPTLFWVSVNRQHKITNTMWSRVLWIMEFLCTVYLQDSFSRAREMWW